jgi:type IV fimbrial biogenesis protein FimT
MPNRARTRREPQQGKNGFSITRGFTLIELMIVISVIAIIGSLALPSYRSIQEKRQVTSAAEQLAAFLSTAQMESVKRSENLTVSLSRTDLDTWCLGAVLGTTPCNCATGTPACTIDGQTRVFSDANLNYPAVMDAIDSDGDFVFDPARGLIYDDSGFSAFDEAELELVSDNNSWALNVQITQTGRVKICSDAGASKEVPGYETCARDIQ